MSRTPRITVFIGALTLLLAACAPATVEPGQVPAAASAEAGATPTDSAYPPPRPTPYLEPPPSVLPTPIEMNTFPPTLTPVPMPTADPTPEVTPIPTVATGIVPASSVPESFWIYGWRDNSIVRVNSDTLQEELVLDTEAALGQPLADNAPLPHEEFALGQILAPAPGGDRLAIVTAETDPNATGANAVTFHINVYDIASGNLQYLAEGMWPSWAPDGNQLAFLNSGDIWATRLASPQVIRLAQSQNDAPVSHMVWSPDNRHLAFYHDQRTVTPENPATIWFADSSGTTEPRPLFTLPEMSLLHMQFSNDGKYLYFNAGESYDSHPSQIAQNLWEASVQTGDVRRLTEGMIIEGLSLSPDGEWLFFSGYHLFESSATSRSRDVWLLQLTEESLYRLTADYGQITALAWSPSGTQVVFRESAEQPGLIFFSLVGLTQQELTDTAGTRWSNVTTPTVRP